MNEIRIGLVGIGNCASALVQGIYFYGSNPEDDIPGLMSKDLGGYFPKDIQVVAAFDVDQRKVGKDVSEAVFSKPNCTRIFHTDLPEMGVRVEMGRILDGATQAPTGVEEDQAIVLADTEEPDLKRVVEILKESECEILVNYLPVGSQEAAEFYAQCALEAGVGFVNCVPVFIASDRQWAERFVEKGLPIIGDDIKSQVGATIVHRVLSELFEMRGVKLTKTYQLNVGGNTDFMNMLDQNRLSSKRRSKTQSVQSALEAPLESEDIRIGPSDYVPWLQDNKVCFIRMEGSGFGGSEMSLDLRLSVQDSSNSAGVVIDAIRCCRLALDRNIGGPVLSPSAFFMKHPPEQCGDHQACERVRDFIERKRDS